MTQKTWIPLSTAAALTLALNAGSCSSSDSTAPPAPDGGSGLDATTACTTDAQCAATVPVTTPANCATGKCNAVQGVCEYVAKDEDGDGHTAANCKSTTSVPVLAGDDCNDNDAMLYPGHPEACTPDNDAGVADGGYCPVGQLTCLADGTESACSTMCDTCMPMSLGCDGAQPQQCNAMGTAWVPTGASCAMTTSSCLNGTCVPCTPGTTQCSGNGVETCDSTGHWGAATACVNQTCVSGPGTGTCTGVCAPGQGECEGNDVWGCNASGVYAATTTCTNQTCVQTGTTAACDGVCAPGQTECIGNTPQTCSGSGAWQPGTACGGASLYCVSGSCNVNPPSCAPGGSGMTNCGGGSASCCASLEVTGGMYSRTYTNDGSGPTGEADPATVSNFRLDEYEVTVGRFRQFVTAWNNGAGYLPPAGSGKHTHLNGGQGLANSSNPGTYETGWDATDWINTTDFNPTNTNLASCGGPWTATPGSNENLPITCVNWYESYAFCIWDGGGFLPSEAEWEYAAAGGSQELEYPWGSAAVGTACPGTGCQYAIYSCEYPNGAGICSGLTNMAPVGTATLGAGVWGQFDLAGSVFEYTLDSVATYVNPCTDCAYLGTTGGGVLRGGGFENSAADLLPTYRVFHGPADRNGNFGFRCARTP